MVQSWMWCRGKNSRASWAGSRVLMGPQWAGQGQTTVSNRTVRVPHWEERFPQRLEGGEWARGTQGRAFKAEAKAEQRPWGIRLVCSRSVTGWRENHGTGGGLWSGLRKQRVICQAVNREEWHDLTYVSEEWLWLLFWEWLTWGQS